MPDEPTSAEDAMEEVSAVDIATVERLAALDDRLAGHGSGTGSSGLSMTHSPAAAEDFDASAFNPAIDTILLLRQVAAAERDPGYDPIVLPQRIGRYEIVREAGRGAFAYVLEARDEILHRRVALKVARPEALVSVPFRRRFVREAELAARLIHPNIVAIHEVGEEAGLVFIASEYCDGGDLADWLERHPGPMPPREAAELVRGLAAAVAYAHASGIVHRDIKPANVLLGTPPGRGEPTGTGDVPLADMTVKLGDFGLGKLFHDRADEEFTQLTRTGSRLGTPAWMAPEQIDHSFGAVGPATDIHALGLLLDRMLTGRCAFGGKTEAEIFRAVLLEEAVSPDRVSRRVPRDLAAVALKCLAKRPADRYAAASDVAEDLSRYLSGKPTRARPLSTAWRMARSVARRPLFAMLAAAAAGGLLLAGWAATERSREASRHAQSQAEKIRLESATELRRGFEAWRTGNAAAAGDHLRACRTIDADLADSLAGRWLVARLHGERDMLLAPADPPPSRPDLYCFAYTRDGRTLAAGGADGRLRILRLTAEGAAAGPPLVIDAHDEVNDVAFSPDGSLLASAGEDGRLCVWNVADGTANREPFEAAGPLFAAAFSPDGTRLACGGAHQTLSLVSPGATGDAVRELYPFADAVAASSVNADSDIESLQFIDDDSLAMACGSMVAVFDVTNEDVRVFPGHDGMVGQIALSRDGERLLSAGTDREPRVWDLPTGRLLLTLPRHPSWIQGCDFSPDGNAITTGCRDGVVRIFDAATGSQMRAMTGHVGRTWDVKWEPSGMVVSAGADGTLRRWDLAAASDAIGMRDVRIPGRIDSRGLARSRRCAVGIVATGSEHAWGLINLQDRTVMVEAATGSISEFVSPSSKASYSVAIDASRRRFAAMPRPGLIEIHPLQGTHAADPPLAPPVTFRQLTGTEIDAGEDVIWTPSGMLLAGCDGGRLLAWQGDLDRAIEVDRLERAVDAVRIAPAGPPRLAIAAGKVVRVYPLPASGPPTAADAKTIVTLPGDGTIVKLAWSRDGKSMAYGTSDGHVTTVDSTTGGLIDTFPKHTREVTGIAWSPSGRVLVTSDTECVRFSDVATAMTFDELRPGWTIDDMEFDAGSAGASPLLMIAGSAAAESGGTDREAHVGIFDLRHASPAAQVRP